MTAFYSTVAGIGFMVFAVLTLAWRLRVQRNSRRAKEDLLNIGVMFIAIVLFAVIGVVRQHVSDSALPLVLTVLGVAGLVTDFLIDLVEDADVLKNRRSL